MGLNPWLLVGWGISLAGAFAFGRDVEQGAQALADQRVAETRQLAAEAIARIEVQRVEITQPVLREVRTRTVYADCRHGPDGVRALNAALTGTAGGGVMSAASAPR